MIYGIGTDIVSVARMADLWQRHGVRGLEKILAEDERAACVDSPEPARFLAKRFAAKEALSKALGSGLRAPVLMPAISVIHNEFGKPDFAFTAVLSAHLDAQGLTANLSISDEREFAVAFVIVEQK